MNRFPKSFWISSILFTIHQIVEYWYSIPLVHAYLDDLLAPGIVLGLALYFFQFYFPGDPSYQHSRQLLILFVFWYAILFEGIFPAIDSRHFADPWDFLAYAVGTMIFKRWGNKPYQDKMS